MLLLIKNKHFFSIDSTDFRRSTEFYRNQWCYYTFSLVDWIPVINQSPHTTYVTIKIIFQFAVYRNDNHDDVLMLTCSTNTSFNNMNTSFYNMNTSFDSMNTSFYSMITSFNSTNTSFDSMNTSFDEMNTSFDNIYFDTSEQKSSRHDVGSIFCLPATSKTLSKEEHMVI